MDTAFCRIYHVECRGWVEQKRFSFTMLGVVLLLIAASIFLPTMESALTSSTDRLPFGLSDIKAIDTALLLAATVLITFAIFCVIFWAVPKGHMPWRDVWPGAAFVTITATVANWPFPSTSPTSPACPASARPSASSSSRCSGSTCSAWRSWSAR